MEIIITGASSGIGLYLAEQLTNSGHTITNISRRECKFANKNILCDLSSGISEDIINSIKEADAVVLGSAQGQDQLLTLEPDQNIEKMITLNLTSNILLVKQCAKAWLHRHNGKIVIISSIAAKTGLNGLSVYSATKAGLEALTRSTARELGHYNITVNCVSPGFIDTPMTEKMPDSKRIQIKRRIPLNRFGTCKDVADTIEFVLNSNWITGQTIIVDGGFSI